MDQNEPKDKNGNLNEKKLPGDPVSLYIVSFSGTEQDRIPTVKLKIPGKGFLKSEFRTSVTFS